MNQADVAALIASIMGVRFPKNSVGVAPVEVLDVSDGVGVKILIQNTRLVGWLGRRRGRGGEGEGEEKGKGRGRGRGGEVGLIF